MSATATAIAYSPVRIDVPRRRATPRARLRTPPKLRPWSEVSVADRQLQAIGGHPRHIKGSHFAWLVAVVIALHATFAWYIATHTASREPLPSKAELNIEIVRPPKPVEPPKVEPPKPQPQKVQPKQAQVLPQIEQSDPLPSTVGEPTEAPVAVAPIVSASTPPAPEPVLTLPVGHAGYLNNPEPDYPPQAARQGWEGTVVLRVQVLANGTAGQIEVKKSSGRRVLDDAALQTVKRWAFSPAKRGDTPIDYWYTLPIEFLL